MFVGSNSDRSPRQVPHLRQCSYGLEELAYLESFYRLLKIVMDGISSVFVLL